MNEQDRNFHLSNRPSWGPDNTLVYAIPSSATRLRDGSVVNFKDSVVGEHKDIRFAKFAVLDDVVPVTIDIQKSCSKVVKSKDVPSITVEDNVRFADFASVVDQSTPVGQHEHAVWTVASILFDDIDASEIPAGLKGEQRPAFISRLRKDKLSNFWKGLVRHDVDVQVFKAKSAEEKAMLHLSAGDITSTCTELFAAKDFKLATMFAQLPGSNEAFQDQIRKQITHWDELNVLSDMSTYTRAFYEILAGNVSDVVGKPGPQENRREAFCISEHFNLDWKRSFGLRLWYGTLPTDSLEDAIQDYLEDIEAGSESVMPVPWFAENSQEQEDDGKEDLLWGLLKLYAAQQSDEVSARLKAVLANGNTDHPLDARLNWQLMLLLRAKGIRNSVVATDDMDDEDDSEKENRGSFTARRAKQDEMSLATSADALTSVYVSALTSALASAPADNQANIVFTAAYALLHLSDPDIRRSSIMDLLYQTAPLLSSDSESPFTLIGSNLTPCVVGGTSAVTAKETLTLLSALTDHLGNGSSLALPRPWLAEAQALWARAVNKDAVAEAKHLLEAGRLNDAHNVLVHDIGPKAIVRRNYDDLREVLGGFEGKINQVPGWRGGGAVFFDFIEVVDLRKMPSTDEKKRERSAMLKRLIGGLEAMGKRMGKDAGVVERASLWEMGRVVADVAAKEQVSITSRSIWESFTDLVAQATDKAKILNLPLTEDVCLKHTRELSLGYYRALMAGGGH